MKTKKVIGRQSKASKIEIKKMDKNTKSRSRLTGSKSRVAAKRGYATRNKITSESVYKSTLAEIDKLMRVGEENLTVAQIKRLRTLATAAELYEDNSDPLPSHLPTLVKNKLNEMGLSQTYAATLLGVSDTKFSQIMNGKQKPDVYFLKAVHEKLNLDGNVLLATIAG